MMYRHIELQKGAERIKDKLTEDLFQDGKSPGMLGTHVDVKKG